ncbi:leucine-rich repeat, immunoglobulin-like domain and transmembrane domain-containing protein 1 [Phascolarctos cinereus]|uniref:leucine-rich repeat, immunoglobulin-like domain and transmembrane domain-containing protein 1 n=1 Tax=Phascolarctos cinereus TaxID=38626 RepID=UPI000A289EA1|nr:leucine-rich repeat, immunoglobulin-like domain and transmembrane domain-containing protein 1 [Phascolarctos cinereus]
MWVAMGVLWCLALRGLPHALGSCPSQCSCTLHSLSDGTKNRVVVCNDPEMTLPPMMIPSDTSKLRIEKTSIRRVPGDALHQLTCLEYLWLPYNSMTSFSSVMLRGLRRLRELRLPGNHLVSFPWGALGDTPQLRLLDLHGNRLSAVSAEAARYVRNLTFLDLSSNQLMRLPQQLLTTWSHLQAGPYSPSDNSKIILGLQDNPWVCDCSLYEMVQILNFPTPNMAFIDPRLKCSTPWSLAGVAFSQLELRKCQRPEVYTSVAKVKTLLGSTVFLRCGATGVPSPELSWRRADGHQLNGTVHQETSSDGMSWSLLGLPEVSHHDSGEYVCKAKNSLGATEAFVSLIITEAQTAEPQGPTTRPWPGKAEGVEAAAYNELVARYASTTSGLSSVVARPTLPSYEKNPALQHFHMNALGELSMGSLGEEQADRAKDQPLNQLEPAQMVRSVKVVGDTYHSVTLMWKAPQAGNTTMFSILYAIFGEKDMRRVSVDPGKTKVTIEGLMPKTKYVACVCVRGLVPKKEQCIIFSTDEVVDAEGTQRLINIVVISIAAIIAVPLTLLVCCGSLKRRYQKFRLRKNEETQSSYVTFERLGPGEDGVEDSTRDSPEEGDRLLSSRSSMDSHALSKVEGPANEYFC